MSSDVHPFERSLRRLELLRDHGQGLLMPDTDSQDGWFSVADLATESHYMDQLFQRLLSHYKATRRRPPAMFWFGHYAYTIELITFACFLLERRVPDLSINQIWIRLGNSTDIQNVAWKGRSFAALPDDPDASHPDCTVLPTRAALRGYMQEQLIAHLTPVVHSIAAYSSLGKPGLWEIAKEYTAFAFVALGELLGDESIGVEESRAFSATPSRLSVRRNFIPIEHISTTHYLLDRISCCLYYQIEGGTYCHSCPHRPAEERISLMKQYWDKQAVQAA
jgi:ferric iron reductase protein FhuF